MKRLAVIPSDPIRVYLAAGYDPEWLRDYFNPCRAFEEVYLLSPLEEDNPDLLGMKALNTHGNSLRKLIRQLKIDVVRAYGGYWACDMACKNKVNNVPVVVSVHDSRERLLFDSIKEADIVLCMSQKVKSTVLTKYTREGRVWILPNRVNFGVMKPYSAESFSDLNNRYPFKYRIIHVGRKSKEKNLDTLIKTLKILGDDYCLLAIGKGKKYPYEQLALSEGVLGRCFFINSVNNRELARYYSWCDCMCTPSRSEGFGIVFIEALACESVVVTSDIAPMNEYINNMYNGLLVKDYENPKELAQTVKSACTQTGVRKVLKENSRLSVLRFEKSRIDSLEAGLYSKILDMKKNNEFFASAKKQFLWSVNDYAKNLVFSLVRR